MSNNKKIIFWFNIVLGMAIFLGLISILFVALCRTIACSKSTTCEESSGKSTEPYSSTKYSSTLGIFTTRLPSPTTVLDESRREKILIDRLCGFDKSPIESDDEKTNLLWLGLLFRHGDRTPLNSDLKSSIWERGPGMLTDVGRQRMFCFGQAIRRRYHRFVVNLKHDNIVAKSSPSSRCIESNEMFLSGLYKPNKSWTPIEPEFGFAKQWSPIAIHSSESQARAWMLSSSAACEKAQRIHDNNPFELRKNEKIFLDELKNVTDGKIQTYHDALSFYDTRICEQSYLGKNITFPGWFQKLSQKYDIMETLGQLSNRHFARFEHQQNYLRLKAGTFFSEIYNQTKNLNSNEFRLNTYSSHDSHIANILQAIELYSGKVPTFGSGLIIELRINQKNELIIRLLYSNTTQNFNISSISFHNSQLFRNVCAENICKAFDFFAKLQNFNLIVDDIQKQCQIF